MQTVISRGIEHDVENEGKTIVGSGGELCLPINPISSHEISDIRHSA
jgi:hypothetical protein